MYIKHSYAFQDHDLSNSPGTLDRRCTRIPLEAAPPLRDLDGVLELLAVLHRARALLPHARREGEVLHRGRRQHGVHEQRAPEGAANLRLHA